MSIVDNIRIIRSVHGLKQDSFARILGVTLDQQKNYESGRGKPNAGYMHRLCKFSGFTMNELMEQKVQETEVRSRMEKSVVITPIKNEGGSNTSPLDSIEIDYKQLYIESLQSRLQSAEEEIKTLRSTVKTNLATIQVLLQSVSNQVTAHDEVMMKALDQLLKKPEGTLGAASDKLEVEVWKRIAQIAGLAGIPLEINVSN